jgi:hypothetical protein
MGTPSAGLLAALRNPQVGVARHLFFELGHSQGTVFAWDGIGDFILDGDTYTGVGDLASVEGVSQTRELQNNYVEVSLQGVSFDSLRVTDQDIRGDTAVIKCLWIDSDENTYGPVTLFSGLGENMTMKLSGGECTLTVRLRAPLANWARPPAAYYTPGDQKREFADDTGLDYVPGLELASASGWSVNEETTGGTPYFYAAGDVRWVHDTLTNEVIGDNTNGACLSISATASSDVYAHATTAKYQEDTTGVALKSTSNTNLKVGGVDCYIDISGDVRTAGGELVKRSTGGATELRKQGTISAIGTATATTINYSSVGFPTNVVANIGGTERLHTGANPYAGTDLTRGVYCNKYVWRGGDLANPGLYPTILRGGLDADRPRYYEAGTGDAVAISGGKLQCHGADCTISSTGAVRTDTGNFVVLEGGGAGEDLDAFLRIWT